MKYMHFNSSCSYTALAILLEDKGIETEDVDISIEIGLPWIFAEKDGIFLSGPMLQGKEWFDLYLNPKGLCLNEDHIKKENIPSYLKAHGKCMLGVYVQGNGGKHAVVFHKYDGQYHFYNPIKDGSDAPTEIVFNETQLLQALDDITIVASILECPKSNYDKRKILDQSTLVLRKLYSEIEKFSKRPHSDEEYKEAMDVIFRAILLDGITMLEISGQNKLAESFRKIQHDFLVFMKGNKKGILADTISLEEFQKLVLWYEKLIMEKRNIYEGDL